MMSKGTSNPGSETSPIHSSSPTPSAAPVRTRSGQPPSNLRRSPTDKAVAGPARSPEKEEEGWQKPTKLARRAAKGKTVEGAAEPAGSSPGPLALVPARMEIVLSSSESVERAMVDPGSMALKRARSSSPDGRPLEQDREAVAKMGPRTGRQPRRSGDSKTLLLLPAPPPQGVEVSLSKPCMSLTSPEADTELVAASAPEESLLVNVPVGLGEVEGGGTGVVEKVQGAASELRPRVRASPKAAARVGGPIRRPKSKSRGPTDRREVPAAGKQKKGSGSGSGVKGRSDSGSVEQELGDSTLSTLGSELKRVAKGKSKAVGCCGGAGGSLPETAAGPGKGLMEVPSNPGGPLLTPRASPVKAATGGGSPNQRGGKAGGMCAGVEVRTAGDGRSGIKSAKAPGKSSPAKASGSRSMGGRSPGGPQGTPEKTTSHRHADLVRKLKGALLPVVGQDDSPGEEERGGRGGGEKCPQ